MCVKNTIGKSSKTLVRKCDRAGVRNMLEGSWNVAMVMVETGLNSQVTQSELSSFNFFTQCTDILASV